MDTPANETSADELTLRSVDERIKQAIDPILSHLEEVCALLASRSEVESAGNSAKRPVRGVIVSLFSPHGTGSTMTFSSLRSHDRSPH